MIIVVEECTGDEFELANDKQVAEFRESFDQESAWMWDEMVDLYEQIMELEAKLVRHEANTNITIRR
jgi:hypothetical protein